MFKRMICAVLAICLILPMIHLDAAASEAAATTKTVTLFAFEGDNVKTTRGTEREFAARIGTRLHDGYTVITGADSFCTLKLSDGSLLTMDEKSKVQISTASRNKLSVTVLNGGLLVDAAPQQGSNTVDIRVGSSALSIRGTFFAAENRPDGSAIYTMFEGAGDVDGVRLPHRHMMNVHATASPDSFGALTERSRDLSALDFQHSSAFVLEAVLSDAERFINNGVISQNDIPGLTSLLSERQEERHRAAPPVIDGVRRFFDLLETDVSFGLGSDNHGESVSINYAPLHIALANAHNAKLGVLVDTSAFNVNIGSYWVTRAVMDDFDAAIDAVEALLGTEMTTNQIAASASALDALRIAFIAARSYGAKPEVDGIHAVLYGAGDFIDGLNLSIDGLDIPFGEPWVNQDVYNDLHDALAAFEASLAAFELALKSMGIQWQIRSFSNEVMTDEKLKELYQNLLDAVAHLIDIMEKVEEIIASSAENSGGIGENAAITVDNTAREVIGTANEALRGVVIAETAADVPADRQWVTPAVMSVLNDAILTARDDIAEHRSQQMIEVQVAFADLLAAQIKVTEVEAMLETKLEAALEKAAQVILEVQEENEETLSKELLTAFEIDPERVGLLLDGAMTEMLAAAHAQLAPVHAELAAAHAEVSVQFDALLEVRQVAAERQMNIADILDTAISTFNNEKQWGAIPVHVNKTLLTEAIRKAYDAKNMVNVSNEADGVLRGEAFVPRLVLTELNTRIREAERVWQDAAAAMPEVERVALLLDEAVIMFEAAKGSGTRDPEVGRLVAAIMSAITFITDTKIDENSGANTPFDERWVSLESMTDFAGENPAIPIKDGVIDLPNVKVGGILSEAFITLESVFVGDVMQADVDDMAVALALAQWACYDAGGWGSSGLDLFPEEGPEVWKVKRADGTFVARIFANPYNAQVAATHGDTLILTDDTLIDGMLILFKDVDIIIENDVLLTLSGDIAFSGTLINNGTIHLDPMESSAIAPWLMVVSGATLINAGTIIIEPALPGALSIPSLDVNGKTPHTVFDPNSQPGAATSFGVRYSEGMFCPTGEGTLADGRFINEPEGIVINRGRVTITGRFENRGTLHNDGLLHLEENTISVVPNPNWIYVFENDILEPAMFTVPAMYISNGSLSSPGKILSGANSEIRIRSAELIYSHADGFINNGELNILRSGLYRTGEGIAQPGDFANITNPPGGSFSLSAGAFTNNGNLFVDGGDFSMRAAYLHSSPDKTFINNGSITIIGAEELGPGRMTPGSDIQTEDVIFTSNTPGATFRVSHGAFAFPSWKLDRFREADGSPLADALLLPMTVFTWDGDNWLAALPDTTLDTSALSALLTYARADYIISIFFSDEIAAAQLILETAKTQEELDDAFDFLWTELDKFGLVPSYLLPTDRTALNAALAAADDLMLRLLTDILIYGQSDLQPILDDLSAASSKAGAVRPSAGQAFVDEAAAALNAAIAVARNALASEIDLRELQAAITAADEIAAALFDKFAATFDFGFALAEMALSSAIATAKAVGDSPLSTQADIDTAVSMLFEAMATAQGILNASFSLTPSAVLPPLAEENETEEPED